MQISISMLPGAFWVIGGALVTFLTMRYQYASYLPLMVALMSLIAFIGDEQGWIWMCICALAFTLMCQNPLNFLRTKLRGENPEVPR